MVRSIAMTSSLLPTVRPHYWQRPASMARYVYGARRLNFSLSDFADRVNRQSEWFNRTVIQVLYTCSRGFTFIRCKPGFYDTLVSQHKNLNNIGMRQRRHVSAPHYAICRHYDNLWQLGTYLHMRRTWPM